MEVRHPRGIGSVRKLKSAGELRNHLGISSRIHYSTVIFKTVCERLHALSIHKEVSEEECATPNFKLLVHDACDNPYVNNLQARLSF